MLIDRGVLARDGRHWRVREGEQVPLPESVQAIIAARLDALSADEKALLRGASVMGKVVWLGAVEAIAGVSRRQAEELLHRLERKEFVRRERQSSVAGEMEYAFRHILVRDVAYGQVPRRQRTDAHRSAAQWVESLAGERGDRVELIAHHYSAALELSEAAGLETSALVVRARRALAEAAERALALASYSAAASSAERALTLTGDQDPTRARLLYVLGKARFESAPGVPDALYQAVELLTSSRDLEAAADAETMIGVRLANSERRVADGFQHAQRAVSLVTGRPASREKAWALSSLGSFHILGGGEGPERGVDVCREALSTAAALPPNQAREVAASAHGFLALGLIQTGAETAAREHLEAAVSLAMGARSEAGLMVLFNAADCFRQLGDVARAREAHDAGERRARELGAGPFLVEQVPMWHAERAYEDGSWDEAMASVDAIMDGDQRGHYAIFAVELAALILSARGDAVRATRAADQALDLARESAAPEAMQAALSDCAWVMLQTGHEGRAAALVDELVSRFPGEAVWLPQLVRMAFCLDRLGRRADLARVLSGARVPTPWRSGAEAICRGEHLAAADILETLGALSDAALCRLSAARALVAAGRGHEAQAPLSSSLAFFRRVRAVAMIREGESLLASARSASA